MRAKQGGFGLLDVLLAASILLFVIASLSPLFAFGIQTLQNNSYRSIAQEIASNELEKIKALPYDDIGVINGNPPGTVEAYSSVERNNHLFQIARRITWYDDPSDGVFPEDYDPRDLKQVRVTVSWSTFERNYSYTAKAKIARQSREPLPPGGHIVAIVKTYPDELPVENVKVELISGPSAPRYDYTLENGQILFPAVENGVYEVQINPPPEYVAYPEVKKVDVDIGEAEYVDFYVSRSSSLTIRLVDPFGQLIEKNSRIVIAHPLGITYEESNHREGYFEFGQIFPGVWTIVEAQSSSYITTSGITFELNPLEEKTVDVMLQPRPAANVHIEVMDVSTLQPIEGADIILTDLATSETVTGQTNESGIFEEQLYAGTFLLQVSKEGYQDYTEEIQVNISGNNMFEVYLSNQPSLGAVHVRTERKNNGQPRNGIRIRVIGNNGYNKVQRTGDYAPGETMFTDLEPGTYYVYRRSFFWWIGPVVVQVDPREVEHVVFSW